MIDDPVRNRISAKGTWLGELRKVVREQVFEQALNTNTARAFADAELQIGDAIEACERASFYGSQQPLRQAVNQLLSLVGPNDRLVNQSTGNRIIIDGLWEAYDAKPEPPVPTERPDFRASAMVELPSERAGADKLPKKKLLGLLDEAAQEIDSLKRQVTGLDHLRVEHQQDLIAAHETITDLRREIEDQEQRLTDLNRDHAKLRGERALLVDEAAWLRSALSAFRKAHETRVSDTKRQTTTQPRGAILMIEFKVDENDHPPKDIEVTTDDRNAELAAMSDAFQEVDGYEAGTNLAAAAIDDDGKLRFTIPGDEAGEVADLFEEAGIAMWEFLNAANAKQVAERES